MLVNVAIMVLATALNTASELFQPNGHGLGSAFMKLELGAPPHITHTPVCQDNKWAGRVRDVTDNSHRAQQVDHKRMTEVLSLCPASFGEHRLWGHHFPWPTKKQCTEPGAEDKQTEVPQDKLQL